MSKTVSWATTALIVAVGCHAAQAQTPIPPSPKDFVLAAAQSDQYEIMAAHLADVQGQDAHIRTFAQAMIRDHTRLTEDLRKAATASGLPPPSSGMSSDEAALLSGLQGLRGAEFDKAYARQQELAHAQAVAVEDSFATGGADANLKQAAQTALPTIQDHLKIAQQLRVEVGGN